METQLLSDLETWGVCRKTIRDELGTFAYSVVLVMSGYWVTQDYWLDYPPNEREELSLQRSRVVPTPTLAVSLLEKWLVE